jgi:multisubunit Na+/H+ antiporter MnhB subunit
VAEPVSLLVAGFDLLLALALLGVTAVMLNASDRFESIVLFIALGLLMAITWVRLEALDVAIAEAAIGAGITGALLLAALGALEEGEQGETSEPRRPREARERAAGRLRAEERSSAGARARAALVALPATGLVVFAVLSLSGEGEEMKREVFAELEVAGADNPVTAVLLNFRAYDTVLELGVLLLAVVGAWSLRLPAPSRPPPEPGPVLVSASRFLFPASVLMAGYLLWQGTHGPGGAFQAGAVLAAAIVLLLLARLRLSSGWLRAPLRLGLSVGVGAFALVGLVTLGWARPFLYYRGEVASAVVLGVELAATAAIAGALAAVVIGRLPADAEGG